MVQYIAILSVALNIVLSVSVVRLQSFHNAIHRGQCLQHIQDIHRYDGCIERSHSKGGVFELFREALVQTLLS